MSFIRRVGSGRVFVNLEPVLYWSLLRCVDLLLGNSSSGIMEAASFALPAVNVGIRQRGRERARNVLDAEASADSILDRVGAALAEDFRHSAARNGKPLWRRARGGTDRLRADVRAAGRRTSDQAGARRGPVRPRVVEMRIPLSAPDITEADIEAVVGVLRTPRLSLGPKLEEFEEAVARYVGVPYGVALSSGTAGLHLGLAALGIGEGDEVILPSFTFIAVANAVLYQRARPVFADIDPRTLNLTPESVATGHHAQDSRHYRGTHLRVSGGPRSNPPHCRQARREGD